MGASPLSVVAVGEEAKIGDSDEGGAGVGLYFTGDSFSRKSRRLGSRSLSGSEVELSAAAFLLVPQNQPIGEHEIV